MASRNEASTLASNIQQSSDRYWLNFALILQSCCFASFESRADPQSAGTDLPNKASLAVMRRLGMRFHNDVQYPLGAGVEYVMHRDDVGPLPKPVLISLG
jgi:hypothetical protein